MPDAMSRFTLISSTSLPGELSERSLPRSCFTSCLTRRVMHVDAARRFRRRLPRTRRDLGVDEVIAGARQSRIDFHSFRRWFIRKGG